MLAATAGAGMVATGSLLTSCSSDPGTTDEPKGIENVPVKELGPEASDSPLYPDSYVGPRARDYEPFSDGATELTIVVPQNSNIVGDWNTNGFSKWMEARTGVKIRYQSVLTQGTDGTADLTKINAMIGAGELPDAFLGVPFSPAQISLYGQQGLFLPLDDLIVTYAPELRQVFDDYPDLEGNLKSLDGKTYQFKSISDCYHCRVSPGRAWVHQDHLEDVGASLPTTTEELRELLRLFKEKDPSGTGEMVPMAAGVNNRVDAYIMNSFIQTPAPDQNWMVVEGDAVKFVANTPQWREGLRYLRSLFDEGLIDSGLFTATAEEVLRMGNQGRIGVGRTYYQGELADITDSATDTWARYVALPPLQGPEGVQLSCWSDNLITGIPLLITNQCTNPELLVQWADYQLELAAQCSSQAGEKGVDWDWADEGQVGLTGEQAVWWNKKYPPDVGKGWGQLHIYNFSRSYRDGIVSDPDVPHFERRLHEATVPYEELRPAREAQLPTVIFDEVAATDQATNEQTITPYVEQAIAEFSLGRRDINDDAVWDEYVSTLDKMGIARFVELYQVAYEATPR